jgi:hypothetical protein
MMTSRADRAGADPLIPRSFVAPRIDPRAFDLVIRLAQFLAYPVGRVHERYCVAPPLSHEAFGALAAQPAFRKPLNSEAARNAGFDRLELEFKVFARLSASAPTRLCVLLVTCSALELSRAAMCASATIAHRRIVAALAREERARLREALGEEAFSIATREAPLQYQALADLAQAPAFAKRFALDQESAQLRIRFEQMGLEAVGSFLHYCEPALSAAFDRRLAARPDAANATLAPLDQRHVRPFMRLMRRSFEQWATIID